MNSAVVAVASLLIILLLVDYYFIAYAFVKMDLPKTLTVGSQLVIHGTSAPSNDTRTNCTVAININGVGYQAANMSNSGTTWTFTSDSHAIKAGDNRVTAKFMCFSPTNSTSDFVHHHSANVTGVPMGDGNTTNQLLN